MPFDFDSEAWDQLGIHLGKHANRAGFGGWANAHNAVAYRFRGAVIAEEEFTKTFSLTGDRCAQEEALFAFFFNAVSCIECFLFGLFHVGAMAAPSAFAIATDRDLRCIDPPGVKQCFQLTFATDVLTSTAAAVVDDPVFAQLREFRDTLAHRGSIPRQHRVPLREHGHANIPSDVDAVFMTARPKAATTSGQLLELDANAIGPRRKWLGAEVTILLRETLSFCVARLP